MSDFQEKRVAKYIGKTTVETIFETEKIPLASKKTNVLYIVLDDLGFSQLHCYGSTIHTPNFDRLAKEGLRYNNFHTTAICSATRASLLTGANHHSVGVASLVETQSGCSNGIGRIDESYATIAEILHENNYGTYCVGKWHVSDTNSISEAGPFEDFPLGKGFDHYYGFLTGQMDHFHPELVRDNSFLKNVDKTPDEGYHLSKDLTENAVRYISDHLVHTPEKPFFLYLAYGAMHAPHHAPKEYIEKYAGSFDKGWDVLREKWFQNQKELGIIPPNAVLTPRNELVKPWNSLSDVQKKLYARYMEAFAGFLDYTDEQLGTLLNYLEAVGELDNTIIVFLSDNGASAEGGQEGRYNTLKNFNVHYESNDYSYEMANIDKIGSEYSLNHYPLGWANLGNVPFPWYKTWTYSGGIKDPMIIRYPKLIKDKGGIRNQYEHVIDITPTILDILNIEKPEIIKGVTQQKMHGKSFAKTFADAGAEGRFLQHYEMLGNRSIYKDGWKATVNHSLNKSYDEDEWELYHVDEDYSEAVNVAEEYPEKLKELQEEFLIQAGKYNVFPMLQGSLHLGEGMDGVKEMQGYANVLPAIHKEYPAVAGPFSLPADVVHGIKYGSFSVEIHIHRDYSSQQGVLLATGGRFGGISWYVLDNKMKFAFNYSGEKIDYIVSEEELTVGDVDVKLIVESTKKGKKYVTLLANGKKVGSGTIQTDPSYMIWGGSRGIGEDLYVAVTEDYKSPFTFDGKILSVVVDVAGSNLDLKTELDRFFRIE